MINFFKKKKKDLTKFDIKKCSIENNRRMWNNWDWSQGGEEWTQVAKRYKGIEPEEWKNSLLNEMMYRYIENNSVILEIGPGAGRWTAYLIKLAKKLVLVDISTKCLNMCKEKFKEYSNIDYHLVENRLNSINNSTIDYIWSYDVFVHINPSDVQKYLEDFQRILKPGGLAIIHHSGDLKYYLSKEDREIGMRSNMNGKLMKQFVIENNMKIIEQDTKLVHKTGDLISVFSKPTNE